MSDAESIAALTDKIIRTIEARTHRTFSATNELRLVSHRHNLTITLTIAGVATPFGWWRRIRRDYPEAVMAIGAILSAYTFIFVTGLFARFMIYVMG